jgi:transketolase
MSLADARTCELEAAATRVRASIIDALVAAGSGHTAGPLGMADIFTYLYLEGLRHDPSDPEWDDRDRLVLSNGHICPVLYAAMAEAGYFPTAELETLRKFGSRLQGHPHREYLPGLETSSGPLGSGLSQSVGMALADRIDRGASSERWFYCLLGDGELDEGQNWEAAMLAAAEKLHRLIAIVDRNYIQIDGFTEDVMPLDELAARWRAWNWHVQEIDGHSFAAIDAAVAEAKADFNRPSVIIAKTVPGKGVPEFERRPEWHGKPPKSKEEIEAARRALRTLAGRVCCGDCE